MKRSNSSETPSFVRGRKGRKSVVDCLVRALWKRGDKWPDLPFRTLQDTVSQMQGYKVASSTVRSSVYQYPDLFQKLEARDGTVTWKLTKKARDAGGEDVEGIGIEQQ